MTTQKLKAALVAAVVAVGSVTALAACESTRDRESVGEYIDDVGISTRVKAALAEDPVVKVYQVNVETYRGVVQLSGFVDNQDSARRAVEVAQKISGVRSVKNDIQIKPAR